MSKSSPSGWRGAVPAVLMPSTLATDAGRALTLALAFAAQGWDLGVYFDAASQTERQAALALCEAVKRLGRRALAFDVDWERGSTEEAARDLLARCRAPEQGLGVVPRCLLNAPQRVLHDRAERFDGAALEVLMRANLTAPLALAQAFADAWNAVGTFAAEGTLGETASGDASALADANVQSAATSGKQAYADDAVVMHLIDSHATRAAEAYFSFSLTQTALREAIPAQARALAPTVRVVGVSTPLIGIEQAHAAESIEPIATAELAAAVCYLAQARTITGSTLLVDGGLSSADPPHRRAKASFDEAQASEMLAERLPR